MRMLNKNVWLIPTALTIYHFSIENETAEHKIIYGFKMKILKLLLSIFTRQYLKCR